MDGAVVLGSEGAEVFADLVDQVEVVGLVVMVGLERVLLRVVLVEVLRLVLLFRTGLDCFDDLTLELILGAAGALDLVVTLAAVLAGELATLAGAGLADLDDLDLCSLAKHGAKNRPKTNPHNTTLIFIFLNANMINLLSATKFLIAALTATGSWLLLFGFTRSSRA